MSVISTNDLVKQFGTRPNLTTAVSGINLTVKKGEVFGFLGPNGAGKSSFIDILVGYSSPTAGEVTVCGYDPTNNPTEVRSRVGLLPDAYDVYDSRTGSDHLRYVIRAMGSDESPEERLKQVGLAEAVDQPVGEYSKGMTQRLVLAMALVGDPDLLILDEPSTGLDPEGMQYVRETIRDERDTNTTVFFSSHRLAQVDAVCDRIGILQNGSLIAVDEIDSLKNTVGVSEDQLFVSTDVVTAELRSTLEKSSAVWDFDTEDTIISVSCPSDSKKPVLDMIEEHANIQDFWTEQTSLEELFLEISNDSSELKTEKISR